MKNLPITLLALFMVLLSGCVLRSVPDPEPPRRMTYDERMEFERGFIDFYIMRDLDLQLGTRDRTILKGQSMIDLPKDYQFFEGWEMGNVKIDMNHKLVEMVLPLPPRNNQRFAEYIMHCTGHFSREDGKSYWVPGRALPLSTFAQKQMPPFMTREAGEKNREGMGKDGDLLDFYYYLWCLRFQMVDQNDQPSAQHCREYYEKYSEPRSGIIPIEILP